MYRQRRQLAERKGRWAEIIAASFLLAKGYSITARRYKTPAGEIDLIARRGRTLAFVEVKARSSVDRAVEAVTPAARKRIAAGRDLFLARHPALAEIDVRYDIIAVAGWRIRHLKDAWRDGGF